MAYIGPAAAAGAIRDAGTDWDITVMTAIAGAESGWDTAAISPTHDYGLMQININAWPELFQSYRWDDASQNAQMGHHVWVQQGYRAWTTYTSGAYLKYMDQAAAAAGNPSPPPSGLPGGDTPTITEDWSGWDFSERVSLSAAAFRDALGTMNAHGSAIRSFLSDWT